MDSKYEVDLWAELCGFYTQTNQDILFTGAYNIWLCLLFCMLTWNKGVCSCCTCLSVRSLRRRWCAGRWGCMGCSQWELDFHPPPNNFLLQTKEKSFDGLKENPTVNTNKITLKMYSIPIVPSLFDIYHWCSTLVSFHNSFILDKQPKLYIHFVWCLVVWKMLDAYCNFPCPKCYFPVASFTWTAKHDCESAAISISVRLYWGKDYHGHHLSLVC